MSGPVTRRSPADTTPRLGSTLHLAGGECKRWRHIDISVRARAGYMSGPDAHLQKPPPGLAPPFILQVASQQDGSM